MPEVFKKDDFEISTYKRGLDTWSIYRFLTNSSWAKGVDYASVNKSIRNSLPFTMKKNGKLVGFARVVTDYTSLAYIADLFIIEEFRGIGLAKWLIEVILNHHDLKDVKKWMLATEDAHGLYEKYGFKKADNNLYMEKKSNSI